VPLQFDMLVDASPTGGFSSTPRQQCTEYLDGCGWSWTAAPPQLRPRFRSCRLGHQLRSEHWRDAPPEDPFSDDERLTRDYSNHAMLDLLGAASKS
jgi:hypothetical protein